MISGEVMVYIDGGFSVGSGYLDLGDLKRGSVWLTLLLSLCVHSKPFWLYCLA
jgi:hypothetical protein